MDTLFIRNESEWTPSIPVYLHALIVSSVCLQPRCAQYGGT